MVLKIEKWQPERLQGTISICPWQFQLIGYCILYAVYHNANPLSNTYNFDILFFLTNQQVI